MHRFPGLIRDDVLALACGLRGRVPVDACDSCGSAMPALRRAPQVLVPGGDTKQPCMCRYQCSSVRYVVPPAAAPSMVAGEAGWPGPVQLRQGQW